MRFIIENDFWELFPDAQIGVVVVQDIDNTRHGEECAALLESAVEQASQRLGDADIPTHPTIAPWREAYAAFGVKPNKYRSSIESLLRSARNGNVRSINPLVDLYNSVSLTHFLPCGGEDMATLVGDLHLTRATGSESFVPLGSQAEEPPQSGEVIYKDSVGVICRSWNWREADRTKLTSGTTSAFLCIEALPEHGPDVLQPACNQLASLVTTHLGGTAYTLILTRRNAELRLA